MSELDRRLREAGQAPVPAPDPDFVMMLEEHLRAGAVGTESAARGPARGPVWFPAAAVAAALALVLGAVAVLGRDGGGEVRVASATDTVVVLPDGTVGPATPGLVVPDGSRLQTGSEGHVVAGDTELGPKQEARVKGGTVLPSPTTVPPGPASPTTTAPTPITRPPVVSPTTTPTTRPADTRPTTTVTSGPAVATLKLDARYKGTTARLQWSAYTGRDFAAYLVLRADRPGEPRYPVDDATTVVARITDPGVTSFTEVIGDPAGRGYRVVAVDGERRLVAASPAVQPQPAG